MGNSLRKIDAIVPHTGRSIVRNVPHLTKQMNQTAGMVQITIYLLLVVKRSV
jgi:hypothetical protein